MYEKLLDKINLDNKIPFRILNILFKHSLIKFNKKPYLTEKGKRILKDFKEKEIIESEIRKYVKESNKKMEINLEKMYKLNLKIEKGSIIHGFDYTKDNGFGKVFKVTKKYIHSYWYKSLSDLKNDVNRVYYGDSDKHIFCKWEVISIKAIK